MGLLVFGNPAPSRSNEQQMSTPPLLVESRRTYYPTSNSAPAKKQGSYPSTGKIQGILYPYPSAEQQLRHIIGDDAE